MTEKKQWTPSEMGKKGGARSVQSRFQGKSKQEVSEHMRSVRRAKMKNLANAMTEGLNSKKDEQ